MQTPWGELPVSDAHVHFFSHNFFTALAERKNLPVEAIGKLLDWTMPPPEPEKLAAAWARELDRHGVTRAALIAGIPGDEASVAAAVTAFPKRFYGYFMLDPIAAGALERVNQALDDGYLQGICLFPAMQRYSLSDERLVPILQAAERRAGAVIFVHCGVLTVGVRKKLGLASPFDMRYSNPIDLHPVALRHPKLTFVVPHFGAGYFREALMLCELCSNVCLDTSSSNSWIRLQDSEIDLRFVFRRALDVVGPGRLLFGSDSSFFPRGWHAGVFSSQVRILADLGVGAEDARAIFGGNLEKLLQREKP